MINLGLRIVVKAGLIASTFFGSRSFLDLKNGLKARAKKEKIF